MLEAGLVSMHFLKLMGPDKECWETLKTQYDILQLMLITGKGFHYVDAEARLHFRSWSHGRGALPGDHICSTPLPSCVWSIRFVRWWLPSL